MAAVQFTLNLCPIKRSISPVGSHWDVNSYTAHHAGQYNPKRPPHTPYGQGRVPVVCPTPERGSSQWTKEFNQAAGSPVTNTPHKAPQAELQRMASPCRWSACLAPLSCLYVIGLGFRCLMQVPQMIHATRHASYSFSHTSSPVMAHRLHQWPCMAETKMLPLRCCLVRYGPDNQC